MKMNFLDLKELEDLRGIPLESVDPSVCDCLEAADYTKLPDNPKVSVITLAYNHEPYLRNTIEGVLKQKIDFPFELIIAEDCSTDNTRAIALEYQKNYPQLIRVLYSEKNVGATANSYRAFHSARGEYIAHCEGDDFWHSPEKLQHQIEILESYPNVGLVFCGGRLKKGEAIEKTKGWCSANELLQQGVIPAEHAWLAVFSGQWHPLTCSCVNRRTSLDKGYGQNPFFDKKLALGDTLAWLEILRESDAFFFDEDWVTQEVHEGSATYGSGREYVSRDGNLILCYFAARQTKMDLTHQCQVGVLKARLAIASATHNYLEIARVVKYCWGNGFIVNLRIVIYAMLALVGCVAYCKRIYIWRMVKPVPYA